jgi:signal peptidase
MTLRRLVAFTTAVALVAVIATAAYAWSNGVRFYAVDSGSMSPAFNTGALVVDLPVTRETVFQVGDVITFHPTPGYTATHRIEAIGADGITTKGDANPSSDVGFIQPSMIAGRVAFSVPFGGSVAAFLRQPAGIAALLLLIGAVYLAWHLSAVGKPAVSSSPDISPPDPSAGGGKPW